ncbi:hypothetical protein KIN20_031876 [Parelaphostrongylus tenuis]|uniref:Failed axon connections-like protein n=1 Tax=Parelaphostrongylus tenuis TaxID=148309 RepID=A0AAD5R681_PARTN|nr:hypothetical protein KIN20_031876 [Parelaphostrongylus tenuis]
MTSSLDGLNKQLQDLPNWGKAAVAGGLALAFYIPYKWLTTRSRKSPVKQDWKSGIVYLYQFPRTRILPSPSAPCLKVETWLRMAEIPYENIPCFISVRSKEGTLPFVEFEGVEYPDSSFIIRDLTRILGVKLEDHLNDEQKAVSRAFEELAHNSLLVSHKVFRLENVSEFAELLPPSLYGIFSPIIVALFKRRFVSMTTSMLTWTAIGKHSREEQIGIGSDDIRAISKYLGSKHYFTGFKPTRIDATLFAVLAQIVYAPYENEHLEIIKKECPNIMEYVERIKNRYWPDWADATTKFSLDSNWKKRPKNYISLNNTNSVTPSKSISHEE